MRESRSGRDTSRAARAVPDISHGSTRARRSRLSREGTPAAYLEHDRVGARERVGPERARRGAVGERQHGLGVAAVEDLRARGVDGPGGRAREAVLRHRPRPADPRVRGRAELGEDDGDAAADGLGPVEDGGLRRPQHLGARRARVFRHGGAVRVDLADGAAAVREDEHGQAALARAFGDAAHGVRTGRRFQEVGHAVAFGRRGWWRGQCFAASGELQVRYVDVLIEVGAWKLPGSLAYCPGKTASGAPPACRRRPCS